MTVPVVTAAQAAAADQFSLDGGNPSRALMQRAGAAAAAEITLRLPHRLSRGVAIYCGSGNNGGDGWVIAAALAAAGVRVRIHEAAIAATPDARAERERALATFIIEEPDGAEEVIVDALLGTGATGAPRGAIGEAVLAINRKRGSGNAGGYDLRGACRQVGNYVAAGGATVVAIDLPSGLDATTGAGEEAVIADLTLTFGSVKRGQLINRERCGRIVVLDIGLGHDAAGFENAPILIDHSWVANLVPPISAASHKGDRGRIAVIGGGYGMAGATGLAAAGALGSGAGLVRLCVSPASMAAVQAHTPQAVAVEWPADREAVERDIARWAHAVVIGPGLGNSAKTRALVESILDSFRGPVVIDADGLNVFAGDVESLAALIGGRPAVITPHPAELGRLTGASVEDVLRERFDIGRDLAARLGAVVLLKGVPTVVSEGDGRRLVSASGNASLATGGSGDILSGILGALMACIKDPLVAAGCAAWVHGASAEAATGGSMKGGVRGVDLPDVLGAMRSVWARQVAVPQVPVLAELPDPQMEVIQ